MASDQSFVNFIINQFNGLTDITTKKMFGEYGLYSGEKIVGLICNKKLFIKPTKAGQDFIGDIVEAPPYPGAKPYFLIEHNLEDSRWLCTLVTCTIDELPAPKPKKKKSH